MVEAVAHQSAGMLALMFAASALVVWLAGTRLVTLADQLAHRFRLGRAFAGMLLLGGITSLPELAAVSTASLHGNASLAVNNLLGSAAINVLLLAIADAALGRDALTRVAARPATLMQGVLSIMLMALVALVVLAGDVAAIGGVGVGTLVITAAALAALRISAVYEQRRVWTTIEAPSPPAGPAKPRGSTSRLLLATAGIALAITVAGAALALTGDAIAERAGLSSGMVGFLLMAFATSLPELSSIIAAVRAQHYELAVGDVLGTNLFNMLLLLIVDLLAAGDPVLASAGTFETLGALLTTLMTGVFVVGLLERRDRTIFRMGYDAVAAILIFLAGFAAMARVGA